MVKNVALLTAGVLLSLGARATPSSCESYGTALADQAATQAKGLPAPHWVLVPRELKRGKASPLLPVLRERLGLPAKGGFDAALKQVVAAYQEQLDFTPTGVIDPNTFVNIFPLSAQYIADAASASAAQCRRIGQQVLRTRPAKFIEVNVAAQMLTAYDYDATTGQSVEALRSRVVVGAANTATPLEDFSLWGLKFNPGWTPTPNILARNVVKAGAVNLRWLASHQMAITNAGGSPVAVSQLNASNWRQFHYYQPAGPAAALGVLKFETTSGRNIYLHDTPEKAKFGWNLRLASSGCVRVQEIDSLARWALEATEDNPAAVRAFERRLAHDKNAIRRLPASIPVFVTYRLVDFDEAGQARLYADGYARAGMRVSVD